MIGPEDQYFEKHFPCKCVHINKVTIIILFSLLVLIPLFLPRILHTQKTNAWYITKYIKSILHNYTDEFINKNRIGRLTLELLPESSCTRPLTEWKNLGSFPYLVKGVKATFSNTLIKFIVVG